MRICNKLYLRVSWFIEISAEGPFAIVAAFAIMLILAAAWAGS
jgi:hypothetical protein